MRQIPNLEIHVAHTCNLSCESCSHYSNHGHAGILSPQAADHWMSQWSNRVKPGIFSLLGGEPTVNQRLAEFIPLSRKHWPDTNLQLVTNGFFLHRHPELPKVLQADPNVRLSLSIHHDSAAYRAKLIPILALLVKWKRDYGIRVDLRPSFKTWTRRYHGYGSSMEPFEDEQPRKSWEYCHARYCKQLFQGKLWKCPPLAYLDLQNAKYPLSSRWAPYLNYTPLAPDCSDEELDAFIDLEDEPYCGMCPASPQKFAMPSPLHKLASDMDETLARLETSPPLIVVN